MPGSATRRAHELAPERLSDVLAERPGERAERSEQLAAPGGEDPSTRFPAPRPSAFGFAAAAALYDLTPLLALRAAQVHRERPKVPPTR
jgi:hypothetical protein